MIRTFEVMNFSFKILRNGFVNFNPKRYISGRLLRGAPLTLQPPFPYNKKKYTLLRAIFDKTSFRMNENSKIICIEGPIATGKTKLAQELAKELDMVYLPKVNMDKFYINPYGFDMRQLDPKLPPSCRSYDIKNFCKDPNRTLAAAFQIRMYQQKFDQYIDALTHLLNTGQGVIMVRSPYSDYVFAEAMCAAKYISKGALSVYHELCELSIIELLRPHLIIYLDITPSGVVKRVKERKVPHEVNSKVFDNEIFLSTMDYVYKNKFLKEMNKHSELLIYDWCGGGDTEIVIEDIEFIKFDDYDQKDTRLGDWKFYNEWEWAQPRMKYTNDKPQLMNSFNLPRFDVPELITDAYDARDFYNVWYTAPGMEYRYGYNASMGDTNILTKTWMEFRNSY